jgi:hypothetical protein
MKIAICFSGQIRDGIECSKNIKNYIGSLIDNCDFFVHTWDIETISHNIGLPSDKIPFTQYKIENSVISDFAEIYRPKKIFVEDFNRTTIQNIQGGLRFNKELNKNVVAMFESAFYSNLYKKDYEEKLNFKYDFAIRMRTDLVFSNYKSLEEDLKQVNDKNFVYGAHAECYGAGRVEDVLWFATSSNMDKICNFYDHYGDSKSCWQIAAAHYISNNCGLSIECLKNSEFTVFYNQYRTHFNWDTVKDTEECIKYFRDACERNKKR